ncbi:glycosyl transferase [Elizabethkingia anophelis]|uniref:beta-1,6-N-acetylglucosaminyltransferase n=1 Tax=Elizabethkingia TaxID=308865 RepID=UPI0007398A5E|nr:MULTISPECIES: beta-1,6-N-acetylglucosaminyltransferase [Elizabethkingia]KUF46359.1 glycosyl transferase [Elizabethkingia anophelis]MCT3643457.1 glycosyl transferase [Elizabethkingia anophelis]MCT3650291.1 glycosyl transferase [Elizabethkingia anophelis]MCT3653908.1 glycosyl transferase [Elizabethkingia anophelis]MCT3657711.1 glycosyl transferase [Elizabethkingia anophelis]
MKHAYLIIAHNEFSVLEQLIKALDDPRNDIYLHIDKKVKYFPEYKTRYSNLYILDNRIDVCWGDLSVVEAEYVLFEEAVNKGSYNYYHLLSGVDMPLKSQDEIHTFFNQYQGKEFIGFYQSPVEKEINRKVNKFHFFPKDFRTTSGMVSIIKRVIRFSGLKIQYILGYKRNKSINFKKGTQWVSITDQFVKYVLIKKKEVMKIYKNTFCSDEIFLQTLCWNSHFRNNLFNSGNEEKGCMRMIGWKEGVLHDWENKDYNILVESEFLFARKFNSKNMKVVNRILNQIL